MKNNWNLRFQASNQNDFVSLQNLGLMRLELFPAYLSKWDVSQILLIWDILLSRSLDWAKSPKWTHVPCQMQADFSFG